MPTSAKPLRIGIMLRAIDDVDGQGIYIRKLCDALFDLDRINHYALFYAHAGQSGRYAHHPNIAEHVLPAGNKLFWDQIAVPRAARRERLDVLFHHKFSIPLFSPCPTVVQQRGTEYWMHPEYFVGRSGKIDLWYNRLMIPAACRSARRVLTNSNALAEELTRFVGVPPSKMRTVYAAADPSFRHVDDPATLEAVRRRYGLPSGGYLLMVVKGRQIADDGVLRLAPRKNIEKSIEAYGRVQSRLPDAPPLVVVGPEVRERLGAELLAKVPDPSRIVTPGFVDFADMPAIYSQARALVFPSRYESFGIPIVEAMACGCPVITSTATACPEVAGDAGILVDVDDVDSLADAMQRISADDALQVDLASRGLRRAAGFSWRRSAEILLEELESVARGGSIAAGPITRTGAAEAASLGRSRQPAV